jgi:hypothetical protein
LSPLSTFPLSTRAFCFPLLSFYSFSSLDELVFSIQFITSKFCILKLLMDLFHLSSLCSHHCFVTEKSQQKIRRTHPPQAITFNTPKSNIFLMTCNKTKYNTQRNKGKFLGTYKWICSSFLFHYNISSIFCCLSLSWPSQVLGPIIFSKIELQNYHELSWEAFTTHHCCPTFWNMHGWSFAPTLKCPKVMEAYDS